MRGDSRACCKGPLICGFIGFFRWGRRCSTCFPKCTTSDSSDAPDPPLTWWNASHAKAVDASPEVHACVVARGFDARPTLALMECQLRATGQDERTAEPGRPVLVRHHPVARRTARVGGTGRGQTTGPVQRSGCTDCPPDHPDRATSPGPGSGRFHRRGRSARPCRTSQHRPGARSSSAPRSPAAGRRGTTVPINKNPT